MQATALIGRTRELDDLAARLAAHRLVTLVGPGGIGKTALALAAAERLGDRYTLGAHIVDLTRVDADDAVAGTLAGQLGFPSFDALMASPDEQPALVVLDNCEHVLDGAAEVVADLLAGCRGPTVLATSRSPLDVPGEAVVVLGPLAVPPPGLTEPEAPALLLFRQRVRAAGGEVPDGQLDVAAEVCRALDGVPLALELAAARARALTPAEVLARLRPGSGGVMALDTLSRPAGRSRARGRDRHRSLRATIEWSHAQLEPGDQRFFDRLAVFAGDFTAEAAHGVARAGDEPDDEVATLDALHRLVDASLLVSEPIGPVTRFRQLATLRAFARERLQERGEWDATWERFVDHVADWSVTTMVGAAERWEASILGEMLARFDSHMAALRWCIDHDAEPRRCFMLLATLWGVIHQGHAEEVERWSRRALERWPDPAADWWADAAATAATCRYLLGEPDEAIALAERALALAPPSPYSPITLPRVIAQSRAARGELPEAIAAAEEAVAAAREGVPSLARELEVFRAELAANLGAVDEGLRRVRAVHDEARADGSEVNAVWARSVEASLLLRTDPGAAAVVATEALDRARSVAYPACEAVNLHTLADAALAAGDRAGAAVRTRELIDHLVTQRATTELRNALRTAAVILRDADAAGWRELAATADDLPVVSIFAVPGHERRSLPAVDGIAPLPRRDAVVAARRALDELVAFVRPPDSDAAAKSGEPEREPPSGPIVDALVAAGLAGAGAGRPDVVDLRGEPRGRLARRGDVWEVCWAGRTVTVRHAKGVADLARLLADPGREVHCLDLAGAGAEQASTGPTIDDTARAGYERRIRQLQEDVDEAEAANDLARAERAQVELDTIVDHLTAALGLRGAGRQAGSTAERARSAVTQRLRATIRRIGQLDGDLGRHLEASVRTGTFCVYRPERPTAWETRLPPT